MPNRRRLLSSRTYLRLIEESGILGTWSHNHAGDECSWSPGMYRLLGREPHEVQPHLANVLDIVHPEDRETLLSALSSFNSGHNHKATLRVILPDGQLRWVLIQGAPGMSLSGQVQDIIGFALDISDLQRCRAVLQNRDRRFQSFADDCAILTWTCGPTGNLIEAPYWTSITGLPLSRLTGLRWLDYVVSDDRARVAEHFRQEGRYTSKSPLRFGLGLSLPGYTECQGLLSAVRASDGNVIEWAGLGVGTPLSETLPTCDQEVDAADLRAARALLNWSMENAASNAKLSLSTIRRAEEKGLNAIGVRSRASLMSSYQEHGIRIDRPNSKTTVITVTRE